MHVVEKVFIVHMRVSEDIWRKCPVRFRVFLFSRIILANLILRLRCMWYAPVFPPIIPGATNISSLLSLPFPNLNVPRIVPESNLYAGVSMGETGEGSSKSGEEESVSVPIWEDEACELFNPKEMKESWSSSASGARREVRWEKSSETELFREH